ncbi:MAG: hypothetical protein ACLP9L_29710 [Thermoguttaceae bacterium]
MKRSTLIADYSWVWDANGRPRQEFEPIELTSDDLGSGRNFWAFVLLIAGHDHATHVQFFPNLGENCLFITVDQINYPMVPPPEDYRDWLLFVGRSLAAGSTWRSIVWCWKARVFRGQSCGSVNLEWLGLTGERFRVEWTSVFSRKGLAFQRTSEAFVIESA